MFGGSMHPHDCSRHCSFVVKVLRCMIEARQEQAL
jgi:hypothetical protein